MLVRSNPQAARELLRLAEDDIERQWRVYESRAAMSGEGAAAPATTAQPQQEEGPDSAAKGEPEE